MNLKPWLYAMLSALLSWQAVAESRTGYVDGNNPNAYAHFYTVRDTSYTLTASPQNGWIFLEHFTYTTSNGWYLSGGYSISCEQISGVTTVFVDAASAFSATMEGTMYKPGGSGGSPVAWSVTGMSAASNTQYAVDPATAVIPFGETKGFIYNVNGYAAPSGMWKYTPGQTSYTGSSATYTFPSAPLIAGIYTLTAARNSDGAKAQSADIRYVEVASVSATYDSTTVTSTTDSPGDDQTLYVPKGVSAFNVTTTPNPSGSWPNENPTWKLNGTASGTVGSATYSFNPTTAGTYTVAAFCGASYSKALKIVVVEVKIKQGTTDITNTTHDEIVGKKINLTGEVTPSGLTITSKQWTIPGERIKNYSADTSKTTLTKITSSDLANSSITYYWVNGGNAREVKYAVVIGGQTFEAKATFNVKIPNSTMNASTGTVAISSAWGKLELHYGTPTTPGISFSRTIELPSGFSGTAQYWQTVTTLRRMQKNDDSWQRLSGSNLLDTKLPYSSDSSTSDSPGNGLSDSYKKVTVSDSFTMWLMFKPEGTDSIWIPLRLINWSWSGTASRLGTTWTLDSSNNTSNPSSSETTTFPEWTANVTGLSFIDE